jgi:hypothetical protein
VFHKAFFTYPEFVSMLCGVRLWNAGNVVVGRYFSESTVIVLGSDRRGPW